MGQDINKGMIFNIQRYSLHDGGGIRTVVFLKGCPFRCPWCSNPESWNFSPQLMRRSVLCNLCSSDSVYTCSVSPADCPTGALEIIGYEATVDDVIEEIKKDVVFYETTKGGVTLSGGEPLAQGEFAISLAKRLHGLGINTAIETTGTVSYDTIQSIIPFIDTFLWDFKIMDDDKAQKIVGQDLGLMRENFTKLMAEKATVIPRIPIIPGLTSTMENIKAIADFIVPFGITEVHLLPYHPYGSSKYKALGLTTPLSEVESPDKTMMASIKDYFAKRGVHAIIGGY